MTDLTNLNASERGALRTAVKSVRAEWREKLGEMSRLSPTSKLAKKASVLMLDMDSLDDRVKEAGGEEELVFMICAQVASGVTLEEWCRHYMLERGLVWAFLTERADWYERYCRAQAGVADGYVAEAVGISEGVDDEGKFDPLRDVGRDKLRIETRLKVAGKYDKARFAESGKVGISISGDAVVVMDHEQTLLETARGIAFLLAAADRVVPVVESADITDVPPEVAPDDKGPVFI